MKTNMAAVYVNNRRRRLYRLNGPERYLANRENPLEGQTDEFIFSRYRFRPATIYFICGLVSNTLTRSTHRNGALPVLLQVVCALRYLATGTFLQVIGDTLTLSESSVWRAVIAFCRAISTQASDFIKMPTAEEAANEKQRFFSVAGECV